MVKGKVNFKVWVYGNTMSFTVKEGVCEHVHTSSSLETLVMLKVNKSLWFSVCTELFFLCLCYILL